MQLQVRDASRDFSEALDPVYLLQNQSQHKALCSHKAELLTQARFLYFPANLGEICLWVQSWNIVLKFKSVEYRNMPDKALASDFERNSPTAVCTVTELTLMHRFAAQSWGTHGERSIKWTHVWPSAVLPDHINSFLRCRESFKRNTLDTHRCLGVELVAVHAVQLSSAAFFTTVQPVKKTIWVKQQKILVFLRFQSQAGMFLNINGDEFKIFRRFSIFEPQSILFSNRNDSQSWLHAWSKP